MTTLLDFSSAQAPPLAIFVPINTYRGFEERRAVRPRSLIIDAIVRGTRRSLRRPFAVGLVHEGETWFAENEDLNLFGAGTTASEAIADFQQHFEHFIEYYHSLDWSKVAGDGRRLKTLYADLIGPDAD